MALQCHPDKLGDKLTENDKQVWLQIQKAYDTLMDKKKRAAYDSSLPFDDSIPEEKDINDDNFFEIFEEVFVRNGQFSKKSPVLKIGQIWTPMSQVHQFYRFWESFSSWRDFSQYNEYDVEEANDRYERRYMEQENKRAQKHYLKEERARLNELVDLAYKLDPRIRKEKAEI